MRQKQPTIQIKQPKVTTKAPTADELMGALRTVAKKPIKEMIEEVVLSLPKQNNNMISELRKITRELEILNARELKNNIAISRIHDRFESSLLEQRTTNILLAEMVALHSSVLNLDPNMLAQQAEMHRMNAYNRSLNGE